MSLKYNDFNIIINQSEINIKQIIPEKINCIQKLIIFIDNIDIYDNLLYKLTTKLNINMIVCNSNIESDLENIICFYQKYFTEIILVGRSSGILIIEKFINNNYHWKNPILFINKLDTENKIIKSMQSLIYLPLILSISPNPAAVGARLIIQGSNFKYNHMDKINLIPCNFFPELYINSFNKNNSQINVTLPSNCYGYLYINYSNKNEYTDWYPLYIDTCSFESIPNITSLSSNVGNINSIIKIYGTGLININSLILYKMDPNNEITKIITKYTKINNTEGHFSIKTDEILGTYYIYLIFGNKETIVGMHKNINYTLNPISQNIETPQITYIQNEIPQIISIKSIDSNDIKVNVDGPVILEINGINLISTLQKPLIIFPNPTNSEQSYPLTVLSKSNENKINAKLLNNYVGYFQIQFNSGKLKSNPFQIWINTNIIEDLPTIDKINSSGKMGEKVIVIGKNLGEIKNIYLFKYNSNFMGLINSFNSFQVPVIPIDNFSFTFSLEEGINDDFRYNGNYSIGIVNIYNITIGINPNINYIITA